MNKKDFVHDEIQKLHRTLSEHDVPHMLVAVVDTESPLCDYALDLENLLNYYAMCITLNDTVAKNTNSEGRQLLIDILRKLIDRVNKIEEAE